MINNSKIVIRGVNCAIEIGEGTTIGSGDFVCMGIGNSINIGARCMIADNVDVWATDSHPIVDRESGNLFLCIGGVNALHGLTDTIRALVVREVAEAMDIDQMTNPNVRKAVLAMRKEVQKIPAFAIQSTHGTPCKGVDDSLLSRAATM